MTVRPATSEDVAAVAALERDNLGADAWSEGLVAEGLAEGEIVVSKGAQLLYPGRAVRMLEDKG